MTGRIDVHSHLIPGVDDGCVTIEQSLECARALVGAGYTHCFCTPHVWTSLPSVTTEQVPLWTRNLQRCLDDAGIALKLLPGGEINLRPGIRDLATRDQFITYHMAGKYALMDLWADRLPTDFAETMRWFHKQGVRPILAHPERMRAVQDKPDLCETFAELGVLLQGNLQCFNDPAGSDTRRVAERYLSEGRYFMLGSDMHNPRTLQHRLAGLENAIRLVGEASANRLTIENPRELLANKQPAGG
jgi:protein-tyrosine phosphatase